MEMESLSSEPVPSMDEGVDSGGHRGEEEKDDELTLERHAADYVPGTPSRTRFFSSSDPHDLFITLVAFAR